jgi:mannosyltransferase
MLRYVTVFKARPRVWFILLFISLAAFLLRIFRLDHQSLWYDEAFSVYVSGMSLGDITARTAADIQPPLYYYLLHFWMALAGETEFVVRFLSLLFGVLIVPLMFVTARRLFNRAAALFSALLVLFSPLYLWYSQETRMYSLITFLALLSSYSLLRALQGADRKWWLAFVLANIAAVYTHYFAFVIIAFQLVYCLWRLLSRPSPLAPRPSPLALRLPLISFAAIVAAFLPWLPFLLSRLGEDASYWRGALKLDEAVRHIFINFTTGESVLENTAQNIAAAWLVVLLAGLAAWVGLQQYHRRDAGKSDFKSQNSWPLGFSTMNGNPSADGLAFSILYLVVPLALLLLLFSRNPKFNARYLMIASPGLFLLLGAGLGGMWSLAREGKGIAFSGLHSSSRSTLLGSILPVLAGAALVVSCGLLLGTGLYADGNAFFDPAFTKADFRSVAQYITDHASADEAIILTSGHMFPAFDYYYKSAALPELRLPDDPTLNTEHVLGFPVADDLNRGLTGEQGVWLVQWQDEVADPNGVVPLLLTTNGKEQKVDASFYQIKLRHWRLKPDAHFSARPGPGMSQQANFKNKVELLGWDSPNPTPADQGVSFNLYYQALDTFDEDYDVALRIVDAEGNVWGRLDRRPSGYNYPTNRWKKGEYLFGSYTVPLLPGTPAGDYFATVTFFTPSDQRGLDVLAPNGAPIGKAVKVGPIPVLPAAKQPAVVDLNIQHTINARISPFTLLGYALGRDNASTGESIPFSLFWRADDKPDADYSFQIQFGDKSSVPLPLASAAFPTSQWRAGEIMRGQYVIQIPPDASAGVANLQLVLIGGNGQTADLRQPFTVQKTDRLFVEPPAQFKQEANFNGMVGLAGYDLSAPEIKAGETLTVTLNWKALGKMDKAYTVFVHMLDSNSQPVAQKDAQPLNGTRATPTWVEGEYLVDPYPIALKPDTPPGDYRLEIGWYDASDPSYARLQVIDAGGSGAGDHVILDHAITVVGGQ